jgi:hypothetical protein
MTSVSNGILRLLELGPIHTAPRRISFRAAFASPSGLSTNFPVVGHRRTLVKKSM